MNTTQGTEPSNAPVMPEEVKEVKFEAPAPAPLPMPPPVQRTIERQGENTVPVTSYFPQIRGGVCEFCGILDKNIPPQFQYQLCPHFRGLGEMRCSYCDEAKDPTDVVTRSILNIHGHPDRPSKLVVVCNSYECSDKHIKRFRVNR